MNKQRFMKKAREMKVGVEQRDTSGTWSLRLFDEGILNPGKVNVSRMVSPNNKDQFWAACDEALMEYFPAH